VTVLLALLLGIVLPGIAGGVFLTWFSPDASRPGTLLARALSCGVAVWLISSGLLARTGEISGTSSWITDALLALGSVVLLSLPRSRALLRLALPEVGYLAALTFVAGVAWLPVGALVVRTTWSPLGPTPWYYWSLAAKIAHVGHVPATAAEWGTTTSFLDDYHLFSTGTAMLLTQGTAGVRVLQAVTVLSVVLLACGAALLANALGAGRLASLASVPIVVATGAGAIRLTAYRPEAVGLGLMLLLVALWVDWLRCSDRGSAIAACILAAALSQVHGIAFITAVILVVAATIALCPRLDWVPYFRRCALSGLCAGASVVLLAIVVGAAPGTEHGGDLGDKSGLADPTWEFVRAIRGQPPSQPPSNRQMVTSTVRSLYHGIGLWAALVLAVTTIVLVVAWRRWEARRTLAFVLLALVGLAAVAAIFAFGWSSYVPRRTGAQRFVQEASLLMGPYVAVALASVPFPDQRFEWRKLMSGAAVVVLCAAGFTQSSRLENILAVQRPSRTAEEGLARMNISPDAVVLSNAYTEGYIGQVTGANGLIEGRAPYTFPRVLRRANSLLREARAFYKAPAAHLGFLEKEHISYVLVSKGDSYSLASNNVFAKRVKLSALDASPRLRAVRSFDGLQVYRVRNRPPGG
jgi:hypothetical protein